MVYLIIISLIISLDLLSKLYIDKKIRLNERKSIKNTEIFLWHKKNYGFSYNKFDKSPKLVKIVNISVLILFIHQFLKLIKTDCSKGLKIGYSFILGGGIGNSIDRLKNNCVTDFIYIKGKHSPIFNIADIFILIGTIITFYKSVKTK